MRADKPVFVLLVVAAASAACNASHSPCGPSGTYAADDAAEYCVYSSQALPIVIEGGFTCPAAMQFERDLGSHRVCSDRSLAGAPVPQVLCTRFEGACSQEQGRPMTPALPRAEIEPEPNTPRPPVAGAPASDPREHRVWSGADSCATEALEEGLTGDGCPEQGAFGCGRSGRCSAEFAICAAGILKVSDLEILTCPGDEAPPPTSDSPAWSGADCEAALQDGRSYQSCEGPFVCARRTDDPCCVEYALCNDQGPSPTNVLVRYRFCERACSGVQPDTELDPVTECSHFAGEGVDDTWQDEFRRADLPCEGDFVCWNDRDLSSGPSDALGSNVHVLRWCSEGVVRGQHSTLSNLFIPEQAP